MNTENQFDQLNKIVEEHEKNLSWKYGGDIADRVNHVLGQYRQIADNSIFEAKRFLEDVKTQFKALEIITEGITGSDLNHGQKRVIANHIIITLRRMVDRIDQKEYDYSTGIFDRYNFFRSTTPERRLYEAKAELERRVKDQDSLIKKIGETNPELIKEFKPDLPF